MVKGLEYQDKGLVFPCIGGGEPLNVFRKASFGFTALAGLSGAKLEAGRVGWACNK